VTESYLPVVTGVAVIRDRVLRLLFSDGVVGDVDLSVERWAGVLEPLNDPAFFARVTVDPESGAVTDPAQVALGAQRPLPLRDPVRRWPHTP
jgi:hypothetical protein